MMKRIFYLFITAALVIPAACRHGDERTTVVDKYKLPLEYNFQFTAQSPDIDDPENDKRCYYKVFINKIEQGRTDTALDSQKKYFKSVLSPNRHLLRVEKWVLDEKKEQYVKLNMIDQPKPNFIYFDVPENRIVSIELNVDNAGKAEYTVSQEKE